MTLELESRRIAAVKIVKLAGERAKALFEQRGRFLAECKAAGEFVSEADREIEDLIREEINRELPGENIVGEERGGSPDGDFWCVDPIDGTSNFLCGLPLWGVSVAYCRSGTPIAGAVFLPVLDTLLSAASGSGAHLNGTALRSKTSAPVPTVAIGINNNWNKGAIRSVEDALLENQFEIVRYRCAVAGLAFAALGRLDGYLECGLNLWDAAAGSLICSEVGLVSRLENTGTNGKIAVLAGTQQLQSAIGSLTGFE
ncbi:inositol monophosphatase [Hoeflea sp. TYP-13]|uniref:inositol monophosphatase n=1 Tax=Hoeflea sp. TYP-13 TaxID=3230023 RepID=UPI0034C5BB4E